MWNTKGLQGKRVGRLLVIGFAGKNEQGRYLWKCKCDCGKEIITRTDLLTREKSKSCGCLGREKTSKRLTVHGRCVNGQSNGNPTYVSWKGMKQRCYDVNSDKYQRYGALGTKVCDRWKRSFKNFVEDMGERPKGKTIDRINPYGDYEPSNCRWADWYEQNNNKRRHYKGVSNAL